MVQVTEKAGSIIKEFLEKHKEPLVVRIIEQPG